MRAKLMGRHASREQQQEEEAEALPVLPGEWPRRGEDQQPDQDLPAPPIREPR